MPHGSKVGEMYDAMRKQGMDKSKAARISQSKSGQALATGKPPKGKKKKKRSAAKMCSTGIIPDPLTTEDEANQAYMIERSRLQPGE